MSKIDPNKLLISSDFFSVQGEGKSSGVPSYFVRLGLCNLTCGMSRQFTNKLLKEKSLENGETFEGDLVKEGKATWTCDSTSQWLWRGEDKEFQYLIDRWKEEGIYEDIRDGIIHIIWTGGEPTIKQHQEAIVNFHKYWKSIDPEINLYDFDDPEYNPLSAHGMFYNEIETNGTVYIEDNLFLLLNQINCSPKLSNSGMNEKQRINPEAIKRIMEHSNYQFKFVVSVEEDIKEIFRDFVKPFNIPLKNVVIMPGMDSQDQYHERTHFILETAKKYKIRGLTRLHISGWDRVINV
jgi:organic radical activating enzyme